MTKIMQIYACGASEPLVFITALQLHNEKYSANNDSAILDTRNFS